MTMLQSAMSKLGYKTKGGDGERLKVESCIFQGGLNLQMAVQITYQE